MHSSLIGRHTFGQIVNATKYFLFINFHKTSQVNWDPITLAIFPTYNCTMHCDMCLTHSTKFNNIYGQKPSKDMDIQFFDKILERYSNSLYILIIGNGEALLNKDFFKMIDHASKKKMNIISGSNGLLVGDYIDELCNSQIDSFDISVNGHNSHEFNRMTGMDPILFNKIIKNSAELIKKRDEIGNKKMKIIASFILDSLNYTDLYDMIYLADEIGFDKIKFLQFLSSPAIGYRAEERCLFKNNENVIKEFKRIKYLPKRIRDKVVLPPLIDFNIENRNCDVWYRILSIDGDGNIGGCSCQILDPTISGKFSEKNAWNNEFFQHMRKVFSKDSNLPLLEPCKYCYNNLK